MGVIKKTLFRGNILGKPRHRNMFLDMEENIHIHYRDLRIELSRGEFEDIVATFSRQSKELLAVIEEKKYQDGTLPNANQDDVRVWTESRLKHEVKYHPQRFSLEDCGDGYHFHYRNYKLLIDRDDFHQIAKLFATLDVDGPYAATYDEVLELLDTNEVDFTIAAGNKPGAILCMSVARYHMPKVRDIFNYIGFASAPDESGAKCYVGDQLKVMAQADDHYSPAEYRRRKGGARAIRLKDHLDRTAATLSAEEVNLIKCQVLDLYYAMLLGNVRNVNIDPDFWLYAQPNREVIFPYRPTEILSKTDAERMYRSWADFLNRHELGFVKPGKDLFASGLQEDLSKKIAASLMSNVAACAATRRIHLMGSALRKEMGRYRAPFIHGKLAKLGSDVDILVEIDAAREDEIPGHWHLHLPKTSNGCAAYHVGQVPIADGDPDWHSTFPNIPLIPHLLDAYVYLPSRGNQKEMEAFLKKFGATVFYDRDRDGIVSGSEELERIAAQLVKAYGLQKPLVEKMKVSTENAIFKVFTGANDLILKLFKVSGNYHRDKVPAHAGYEENLVAQLIARGIPTPGILPTVTGTAPVIDGFPALLFERIPGTVQQRPEYPMDAVCAALAAIHDVQLQSPVDLPADFTFDDACMIWLPAFERYLADESHPSEIAAAFATLAPLAREWFPGENRTALFGRCPSVHCHGDVTPKNFILDKSKGIRFFDFNNAFYGPRLADVIDGAYEFSLAEKYIHLADFSRFGSFISLYSSHARLSPEEEADIPAWTRLVGIMKFAKEIRVFLERPKENLRRKRALAIAQFLKDGFKQTA